MAKSRSKKYSGIAELIKDFVSTTPKDKLTLNNLTNLVLNEYPDSNWHHSWRQWRFYTLHPNGNYSDNFTSHEKNILTSLFNASIYPDVVAVDAKLLGFCDSLINVALKYEKLFGKKLNVTAEIGEILVSHKFGLKLAMQSDATYDALDNEGKKVQIKCRRSRTDDLGKKTGRVSTISHSFDYLLLGLLDKNYKLYEVWKTPLNNNLTTIIRKEQTDKSGPSLSSIINISERLL